MSAELRDFLAWFDGWVEGKATLNKEQLARLKDKIKAIPVPSLTVGPVAPPKLVASGGAARPDSVPFDSPQSVASTVDTPRLARGKAMDAGP